ncbi:MAG: autotransporter-associated beta strand repeat-containing protein [Kiritimatiellae bacterium]|nr:autotransporter-associated beta strand repeat-containing protein [Kiritimatiellia bacterium]
MPSFAATNIRWCGTEGDFTDPDMWDGGVVPTGDNNYCADLSSTSAGAGIGYIRDGMNITNGWINCGRTNDFTLVMSGGYVQLMQAESVNDGALKIARGEVVDSETVRPTGTLLMSGGRIVATNGCVSVGERGNGVLTMTGGELWAKGRLSIARLEGSSGTLTVSGGAKVTAYSFNLVRPSATLIIDGGTIARTRFGDSLPNGASFIWGDAGATVQIGANGATLSITRDAAATIPISSVPGTSGTLEKRGAGVLRFSDTATNTYAGATIIAEGGLMAESPHNLPGYDEPGRVTVKSGASLVFGKGWSAAETATAMANVTVEAGASVKAAFDVSDEDVTISDNLSYTGGMEKYGAKMLTLTGSNTFGGEQKIWEGVLRADFGQGLDSGYCVTMAGGYLSSLSGSLVTTIGGGAGQVNFTSSAPGFTARGVPFTVDLLNGASVADSNNRILVTNSIPSKSLNLNDANADQPITFANNIDVRGTAANAPFTLTVGANVATLTGSIMDGSYNKSLQTTFKKYGAGTLRIVGAGFRDRLYRFNVEEGDVVLDHPASVANTSNGSGYFYHINKNGTGTLYATNQTIQTENNFNVNAGTALIKGGKLTVGNNLNVNGGTVVLDGGTFTAKAALQPANAADVSGTVVLTNGVRVTTSGDFTAGSNNSGSYGRIEIFDDCCVTGNVVGAGSGDIVQWGGKVYGKYSGVDHSVRLGRYAGHRGFYYMAGGEFGGGGGMSVGRTANAHGELWQTGGTVKPNTELIIGDTSGATGIVHVVGGEMRPDSCVRVGKDGIGELVVRGEGVVKTGTMLSLGHGSATANGRVMLCKGGTIEAAQVLGHGTTANGRYSEFIFDGGTLRATGDSTTFVSNLTAFAIGTGGGKVDTDGHDVTFAQPLCSTNLHSDLAHRWSFNDNYVDSVTGETAIDNKGGTFVSGTADAGRAVKLKGGNKGTSYVSLGPDKLPVDGSEATIELWARVDTHRNWQRAFDIGKDSTAFFALTWRKDVANSDYCGIKYNGVQLGISNEFQPYNTDKLPWNHICIVCKKGDDGRWKIRGYRKYRDGEDIVKRFEYDAPEGWSLANQDQTYTYIGRSLQNNYDASATYDEFRIWKRALTDAEIEENGALGPDALPVATFEKRGNGTLTLTGANTYAQPTVVSGGTLALAAGAALPADNAITVGEGATLDLGGNAAMAASLTGAGTLANGTLALTGAADISAMSLDLRGFSMPDNVRSMVVLDAAGGVTGQFASVSLPNGYRLRYSGSQAKVVKVGFVFIVR